MICASSLVAIRTALYPQSVQSAKYNLVFNIILGLFGSDDFFLDSLLSRRYNSHRK